MAKNQETKEQDFKRLAALLIKNFHHHFPKKVYRESDPNSSERTKAETNLLIQKTILKTVIAHAHNIKYDNKKLVNTSMYRASDYLIDF